MCGKHNNHDDDSCQRASGYFFPFSLGDWMLSSGRMNKLFEFRAFKMIPPSSGRENKLLDLPSSGRINNF